MTAAYLHILGDLLLSVGVVISSVIIYVWPTDKYPWSKYFDPACTLIFSVIICYTCKDVLRQGIFILMEGAPEAVETGNMLKELKGLEHVVTIHDYHCWTLSKGKYSMSAHLVVERDAMTVLAKATQVAKNYGIEYVTIQMEDQTMDASCDQKGFNDSANKKLENGHGHKH